MSGRPSRKAAQAVSYVQDAAETSEDESMSSEDEGSRSKKKKPALKRRKVDVESSDQEDSDEGEEGEGEEDPAEDNATTSKKTDADFYEIPRVDFSQVLPVEIIAEIFSYLQPSTLYYVSTLNSSLHRFFTGFTVKSLWRKALAVTEFPKLGGEEVEPRKVAALILERVCEICSSTDRLVKDRDLLVRLCRPCYEQNLVPASDIGKDAIYADFHPATTMCAIAASYPIKNERSRKNDHCYYLPDLHSLDEELVRLQIVDESESQKKYASGPEQDEVQKTLAKATKLKKRSWYGGRGEQAKALEEGIVEQFTPRVRKFIEERGLLKKEREILANWMYRFEAHRDLNWLESHAHSKWESKQRELRVEALENKVVNAGIFIAHDCNGTEWDTHPLIKKVEPLTDSIWTQIKEEVHNIIGKDVASVVFSRCGKKSNRSTLFKKPKSRTAKTWSYVTPHLIKLHKAHSAQKKVEKERQAAEAKRSSKRPFFEARYEKVVQMQPTKDAGAYVPGFGDFLSLPTVKELYLDDDFGTGDVDDEADMAKWSERFDDVVEEVNSHVLDVRLHALKTILAATTEMEEDDIEALDADDLASDEYGDDFFLRPSSWLSCSQCHEVGPLVKVLRHSSSNHTASYVDVDKKEDIAMPVRLSLEVACVLSAVFELAEVDENDPEVTAKDLTAAFEDQKLVWENPPSGVRKKRHERWQDLVEAVSTAADAAAKADSVLDVPSIALKTLNPRERWRKQRNETREQAMKAMRRRVGWQ